MNQIITQVMILYKIYVLDQAFMSPRNFVTELRLFVNIFIIRLIELHIYCSLTMTAESCCNVQVVVVGVWPNDPVGIKRVVLVKSCPCTLKLEMQS